MIITDHLEEDGSVRSLPVGNGYVSGPDHDVFARSIDNVFWEASHFGSRAMPDLLAVPGVPGVLFANVVLQYESTGAPDFPQAVPKRVVTKRSTNNGGVWAPLSFSTKDEDPAKMFKHQECNACFEDQKKKPEDNVECSLHVHFVSGWIYGDHPPLYASDSAPGLMMATGNYGPMMDPDDHTTCTWISRDAGTTWEDVRVGNHIYEYGDSGGVIVIAPHRSSGVPTDYVEFSLDYGSTWVKVQLESALFVENIQLDRDGKSDVFLVYGTTCTPDQHASCSGHFGVPPTTMIFTLHMEKILRGVSAETWPDCDESDYEYVEMPQSASNVVSCLLGRKAQLHTRKAGACCRNTPEFERLHNIEESCACSVVDLACEYHTYRTVDYNQPWPERYEHCAVDEAIPEDWCPHLVDKSYLAS